MQENSSDYLKNLTIDEKIRLFNGDGSWKTFSANGKLPYFVMSDGPHGLRKQEVENYADLNASKVATCFPTASCAASSWNKKSMEEFGEALAKEALFEKVNMVLGPGINIKRSPLCGRNFEYFSEDPYLAGTMAANYINGMQKLGVGACVKHFAANNQEKRRQTSNSIIDERTLREIYLRAFEIVVKKASPCGIMGSYNRLNGEFTCASQKLLTEILRKEWNYKGIVISDWGACIDAAVCVKAGLNLAMPDSNGYLSKCLKKALAEKVISEKNIENSVQQVIKTSLSFKKDENIQIDYNHQHETAKSLALESAVLLKNEDFLPLKPGKIAIIGELAEIMKFQGGGSSHITTKDFPNAIESFKALGFETTYAKGYFSGFCKEKDIKRKNEPLFKEALQLAKAANEQQIPVLFFTGLTEKYEGEGFDRTSMDLPQEQIFLLKEVLKLIDKVAVINFSGSPVDFSPANSSKAILQMYLPGEAAGEAVADLISGKINPSGKLAETFPIKLEDTPCFNNFALELDNISYKENVFVGYRHYESKNIPVQYEFGFGLSYTKFEYQNLEINKADNEEIQVTINVKNIGSAEGSEVVQIYVYPIQNDDEKSLRPVKELRGFEKVFLKPGETKSVNIILDENAFKVFSSEKKSFVTIGGNYKVQAAASVKDVRLEKEIQIQGESLLENVHPVSEEFYKSKYITGNQKGDFTLSDSLVDMSKQSRFIRKVLKILEFAIIFTSKSKSKEDPAVKITLSALKENPLESLISTSGGAISEKTARWLLKKANR